jgi:hypothetical protein
MKTLELELKKKVLIVDESDFDYYELSKNGIYFKLEKGDRYYLGWEFEFLCKGSELTEEIASELVDKSIHTGLYAYYVDNIPVNAYCYNSAKEAVISKIESKGFYWLKHNVRSFSLYDPRSKTGCHDLEEEDTITKQWQEAEEKTFRNPLIFVKK